MTSSERLRQLEVIPVVELRDPSLGIELADTAAAREAVAFTASIRGRESQQMED